MAYEAKSTVERLYYHSRMGNRFLQTESLYLRGRLVNAHRFVFWTPFRFRSDAKPRVCHYTKWRDGGAFGTLCGRFKPHSGGAHPSVVTCVHCRRRMKGLGFKLDRDFTGDQIAVLDTHVRFPD